MRIKQGAQSLQRLVTLSANERILAHEQPDHGVISRIDARIIENRFVEVGKGDRSKTCSGQESRCDCGISERERCSRR